MSDEMVLAKQEYAGAVEVREQVNAMQHLMGMVLKEGTHYGIIPGTGKNAKPSLLQPGAEKIGQMFHLVPYYDVDVRDLPGGHREYDFTCTLRHRESGDVMGMGYGLCSTMESKYRYRSEWSNGQKTRVENPDIADCYNTVFKMAKKRAYVDAIKSTTAASDIFTQDVEDMPRWMFADQQPPQPAQAVEAEAPKPKALGKDRGDALRRFAARYASIAGCPEQDAKRAIMAMGDPRGMDDAAWAKHAARIEDELALMASERDAAEEAQADAAGRSEEEAIAQDAYEYYLATDGE